MIHTTTITVPNSQIKDTATIITNIASTLNIMENRIIRWAITATHGDNSSIIVTYAK